jgi:membrane associated rhomboid family serine protease
MHMERLVARLERRFGGYAIPHLTAVLVAGMGVLFIAGRTNPAFLDLLTLDIDAVKQGQVWRLVTYLFLPGSTTPIGLFFALLWFWYIGSALETHWGSFRFNLFYLLGCLGTTVAAWLTGRTETNSWINLSLMLAYGTLFPEQEFFLWFVLRVKAKWLAIITAAFLAYSLAVGDTTTRAAIIAALVGYFAFCGSALLSLLRDRNLTVRQAARRSAVAPVESAVSGVRVCAICGAAEASGADIRVCSCAKCGGPRNLCLPHARNH